MTCFASAGRLCSGAGDVCKTPVKGGAGCASLPGVNAALSTGAAVTCICSIIWLGRIAAGLPAAQIPGSSSTSAQQHQGSSHDGGTVASSEQLRVSGAQA